MIRYSGKLSIEAATALAQANYNHKTQEEIITLKQRIAELEDALAYHQEQTRPIERTQKLLAKRVS
jgi:BMFP domain-containing protein YqiC